MYNLFEAFVMTCSPTRSLCEDSSTKLLLANFSSNVCVIAYRIRVYVAAVNINPNKMISNYPSTLRGDQSLQAKGSFEIMKRVLRFSSYLYLSPFIFYEI
jgi:hypothetical protein